MSSISYSIGFAPRVEKQLAKIPKAIRSKILLKISKLKACPKPTGYEPLQGNSSSLFRIRQGDYRIIYSLEELELKILIVRVVHRKEVYTKKHSNS